MEQNHSTAESGEGWMRLAACKGTDPNLFFSFDAIDTARAVAVCHKCPVEIACGEYALNNNINHGVWGGLMEKERVIIRRRNRQESAQQRAAEENLL